MGPTIGNSATIDDNILGFQGNMVGIYHPQSVLMNWVCPTNLDDVTCPPHDGWLLGWFVALCLPMLATVLVIFRGETHGKKGSPSVKKHPNGSWENCSVFLPPTRMCGPASD